MARDERERGGDRGNGKGGRNFTLSRSLESVGKGLPVFQPSQKPSSDRSAFHALADINGFQPIRAKWNG